MLVASAGTGGTITGIARKLKEKCPGCKVSAQVARGVAGPAREQGIQRPNDGGWESIWVAPKDHYESLSF